MRRPLLAAVLLVGSIVVPAAAAPDRGVPVRFPGRVPVGVQTGEQLREAFAGVSDIAADVLARADRAEASAEETYEFSFATPVDDLDLDGQPDVLYYRTRWTNTSDGSEGSTWLTLHSGRTGARRWTRSLSVPLVSPAVEPVGRAGHPGLMLFFGDWWRFEPTEVRVVGYDGRTGRTVYDTSVLGNDGNGTIQLAGLFDGVTGGGTDVLFGRVRHVAPLVVTDLWEAAPYVLDGADGTVRAAYEPAREVAQGIAFVATGDLDLDSRDDVLMVRKDRGPVGTVEAMSSVEGEELWTTSDLPVGDFMVASRSANVTGGRQEDALLTTTQGGNGGLLEIPPYTDGLPILDGPDPGAHGLLLDGATGTLRWDRMDGDRATYEPWSDVDGDRKADVLVFAGIKGERDGVRIRVVTGAGKVVLGREITVESPPLRKYVSYSLDDAGDMDGDRVPDLEYDIWSVSPVEYRETHGLLMLGTNARVTTRDVPLYGTLDGGTADRIRYGLGAKEDDFRWTILDGARGEAYWHVDLPQHDASRWAWPESMPGARGRCDDVLLHGSTRDAYWVDRLDGATGRIRWSRTFEGTRPADSVPHATGRRARCR